MSSKADKKILEASIINFFGKKKEYQSLSNFSELEVVVDGIAYDSGEHCVQGEKYRYLGNICEEVKRKELLLAYSEKFIKGSTFGFGVAVKRMGGKNGIKLTDKETALWQTACVELQKKICEYKFDNYEVVRDDLFKSRGKLLVHPAMRCSDEKVLGKIWCGRAKVVDGKVVVIGQNILGVLWMDLR
jgi:predicted NAD-dependent protein-ADP-ribosyltransferase YbiA (DUF1768 family)